jgi:type II secretory pathway component PulM
MPKVKTPYLSAIGTGLLACLLILIFDLNQLIDMMSIGTLIAYTLVAASTLVLRYRPMDPLEEELVHMSKPLDHLDEQAAEQQVVTNQPGLTSKHDQPIPAELNNDITEPETSISKRIVSVIFGESDERLVRRLFWPASKQASFASSHLVNVTTVFTAVNMFVLAAILNLAPMDIVALVFIGITLFNILVTAYIIFMQPTINAQIQTFKVNYFTVLLIEEMFFKHDEYFLCFRCLLCHFFPW